MPDEPERAVAPESDLVVCRGNAAIRRQYGKLGLVRDDGVRDRVQLRPSPGHWMSPKPIDLLPPLPHQQLHGVLRAKPKRAALPLPLPLPPPPLRLRQRQ